MLYLKLRRLEFRANYGDYIGQEPQDIRAKLKAAASTNASPEVEKAVMKLGLRPTLLIVADELASTDVAGLRKLVDIACSVLGIDSDHILWLIKEWGERNRVFHIQIRQYIIDCRWSRLADQICRDVKELLNVAPNGDTAANYEKVFLSIQNEYFDIISRDDSEGWFPNERAKNVSAEMLMRKGSAQRVDPSLPL